MVHGPLVEADTKIDVANYYGVGLLAYLYVGTPVQRIIIAFDTGSDWTTFETDMCSNCISPYFGSKSSTTYKNVSSTIYSLNYNGLSLKGVVGQDSVGLLSTGTFTTNSTFKFFAMTNQSGMVTTYDGILGLSRPYYSVNFTTGPLFNQQLKNEFKITQDVFSLYVSPSISYINFGAPNSSAIKSGASLTYINMPAQYMFWFHQVMGVRIGSGSMTN